MNETCGNCRFWEREESGRSSGWCQRYPPQPVAAGDSMDVQNWCQFPWVDEDEWCGEFKSRLPP